MNYSWMLLWSEAYRKEQDDKLRRIANNFFRAIKENRSVETIELQNFIQEYPTYDYNRIFSFTCIQLNILQLAIIANDIKICDLLLNKGTKPISINVNYACRRGYTDIIELLICNYAEANEKDIALWKQTAILNGHHNIAYLIDRLLNRLYIQFSKSNTDYFIKVINTTLKYTLEGAYMDKFPSSRPKKVILQEMLEQLTKHGYMLYTMEYLNALKKIVKDSLSIYKLFHLGAEDVINSAIRNYSPYHEGIMETDKRTSNGALLIEI